MFVSVKFHEDAERAYTYTYDGDAPLEPGSRALVDTPKEGRKTVIVAMVDVPEPNFACKPVVGLAKAKSADREGEE